MKRALFLVAVLFLLSNLAWAQTAGTASAPVADPRSGGGNCQLPDLAGLSPAQVAAAALNAGLKMTFVDTPTVPACPVTFHCDSIANCARSQACFAAILGPCCSDGSAILCCQNGGNLVETTCGCKCTGELCSSACSQSHEVGLSCS